MSKDNRDFFKENEKAKQVIDFCEKNKIDSYIKEKTITPDI